MNRILKFRVWDTIYGFYMIYEPKVFGYRFPIDEENSRSLYNKPHNRYYTLDECGASERFRVEQFTGLQDLNGKDIYEGDILADESGIDGVGFKDGCFWVDDLWLYDYAHSNRVIGNINENPELLNNMN